MVNVRFFLRLLFLFFILTNNSFGKTSTNIIDLDTIFSGDINISNLTLEFKVDSDIKQIENIL